jgi:hypothetical protein
LLITTIIGVNFLLCGNFLCRIHRDFTVTNLANTNQVFSIQHIVDGYAHLVRTLAAPSVNPAYPPPQWTLPVTGLVIIIGLWNALLRGWEASFERKPLLLLLTMIFGALALAVARIWWLNIGFMPVRYYAIVVPAFILLIATGYHLLAARLHWSIVAFPVMMLLIVNYAVLETSYRPLWEMPERVTTLPDNVTTSTMRFENGIRVAGYTVTGDTIALYLTTDMPQPEPLAIEVVLFDGAGTSYNLCEMLAGSPVWSTAQWQVGEYVVQYATLPGMMSRDDLFVRLRLTPLLNQVHVDNRPDYVREFETMDGNHFIPLLPQ